MSHDEEIRLPIEEGYTNNQLTFEETDDFGSILRTLRLNHGTSLTLLAKKMGIAPQVISKIERSEREMPDDNTLRRWLDKLGCKDNKRHLMNLAARHKVSHTIKLYMKDESNADMIRLMNAYKDKILTPLDRALLSLVGRE